MPPPAQSPGDGRIRVALVDDSSIFLRGLTSILELENDFQVVATATSASDGFAAILERQPQVAIVDLRLRRCASDADSRLETGVELLHQIRRATSAPTLVLSSYHHPAWVRAAAQAGAHGFFEKDAAPGTLCAAIRFLARHKLPLWTPQQQAWLLTLPVGSPTPREMEILRLVAAGLSDREVGERLGIQTKTVSKHLELLRERLGVHTRMEAVLRARHLGLLPPEWEEDAM
ncbi:MAG: DNA-binding response regulator [Pirellulaceae bacterium]|jgi:DNA-binding NarL/FixJ family response regulator|uniref:response regulator transcription factor n=1 Tax=Caldilinea sp. TaxID=2293560 RepID=UPI0021DEC242|nr:response regulator transcription factor [uncultured Caldilinea sp.]GIW91869.1 MAG: DNA-binding response regulator [Pirellulaceae bacterium]